MILSRALSVGFVILLIPALAAAVPTCPKKRILERVMATKTLTYLYNAENNIALLGTEELTYVAQASEAAAQDMEIEIEYDGLGTVRIELNGSMFQCREALLEGDSAEDYSVFLAILDVCEYSEYLLQMFNEISLQAREQMASPQ
jgi:hypothetical protein